MKMKFKRNLLSCLIGSVFLSASAFTSANSIINSITIKDIPNIELRSRNGIGYSRNYNLSSNGQVLAINRQMSDESLRAGFYQNGNINFIGTLRADNSGSSISNGLSRNGKFIIGSATNENNVEEAFIYNIENGAI